MLHAPSMLVGISATLRPKPQSDVRCSSCKVVRPIALRQYSNASASVSPRCRLVLRASQTEAPEASTSSQGAALTPVKTADGALNEFPQSAGVYSIYCPEGQLQYIGLSRKVCTLLKAHVFGQKMSVRHAAHEMTCLPISGCMTRIVYVLQIAISIATHQQDLPDLTHSAKYEETPGASKEAMVAKWQEWLQAAGRL